MSQISSTDFENLHACQALVALELPAGDSGAEQHVAVVAVAGLIRQVKKIDRVLGRARAVLIVLQPDRDGRVDLRINKNRSIVGGLIYGFVLWRGTGPRQYARKLPLREAHEDIARGRGLSAANYSMARRLARRIIKLLLVRAEILTAIYALRKANRRLHGDSALEELDDFSRRCSGRALTLLVAYAAQPVGDDDDLSNPQPLS